MPTKNLIRSFASDSYYHIYNRAVDKQVIFKEQNDYLYFSNLFARHIGPQPATDKYGRGYKWYGDKIDIAAFCWMPNHFHLLVFQKDDEHAITELMQSIGTAYAMYFNRKYKRKGTLFETTYKASLISDDGYFSHISRYIHLNPPDYTKWPYSSYGDYTSSPVHDWVKPECILDDFENTKAYQTFLSDYEDAKKSLDSIKHELADK